VFGATHPEELKRVREIVGEMLLLVPGVGTQGGNIDQVLNNENSHGLDMIINASRSIAQAKDPREAAKELQLLTNTYSAWKD
jgi:orotidine-5'-phosphate decarboxylase